MLSKYFANYNKAWACRNLQNCAISQFRYFAISQITISRQKGLLIHPNIWCLVFDILCTALSFEHLTPTLTGAQLKSSQWGEQDYVFIALLTNKRTQPSPRPLLESVIVITEVGGYITKRGLLHPTSLAHVVSWLARPLFLTIVSGSKSGRSAPNHFWKILLSCRNFCDLNY